MKYFKTAAVSLFMILLMSCKKEEVPTVSTADIINILGTTATSGGTITSEGTGTVLSRGVCWSTGTTPTIDDSKTVDGAGAGTFSSNMSGLNAATTYYARAYATNNAGTGYGMAMSFTTFGEVPSAVTQPATNITTTFATLNANVNPNYLSTTVTFEYGINTAYGRIAFINPGSFEGNSVAPVVANITGLSPGTIHHFRVKSENSLGIAYGNDMTFTTLGQAPSATTQAATSISTTAATLNANINPNYLSTTVSFEYGTTSSYGSTVSANLSPIDGHLSTALLANITALNPGTTYHFRVKAINLIGTTYGSDMTFTTQSLTLGETYWLISAAEDQSTGLRWYNGTYISTNGTGTITGTGNANTISIVSSQGEGNYAAKICSDLVLNGYSDWFLPSKDELNTMYVNLQLQGIGTFASDVYWSSSDNTIDGAWGQSFSTQLTFFEEQVSTAVYEPKKGNYFLFTKDVGGNEHRGVPQRPAESRIR